MHVIAKLMTTLASCILMSNFPSLSIAALFKHSSETSVLKEAQSTLTVLGVTSLPGLTEKAVFGSLTFSLEDAVHS